MAGRKWTYREIAVLKALYPTAVMAVLMDALPGRSEISILQKAQCLGVKRSVEYLRQHGGWDNLLKYGEKTRFVKGQTSWNKGKSFYAGGNSVKTHFKKGHTPHNTRPLGYMAIRTNKGHKQWWVKTENGMEPLSRVIWQRLHGAIPSGGVIRHKDGNSL